MPKGSVIDRDKVYYIDNGSSYIAEDLLRHKLADGIYDTMGIWQSSGSASFLRTDAFGSLAFKKVNMAYQYVLRIYFSGSGSDYKLYAVKIEYDPPTT